MIDNSDIPNDVKLNSINEDSQIPYYAEIEEIPLEDGEVYNVIFKEFTFKKELKMTIYIKIADSIGRGFEEPLSVLVPHKMIRSAPKNLSYPIPFQGHNVYIVPYIREIMVLES